MKPDKSLSLLFKCLPVLNWSRLLFLLPLLLSAQSDSIGFSSPNSVYLQSNQLVFQDSMRLNYGLRNFSSLPFSGVVSIEMIVRDSAGNQVFAGPIDSLTVTVGAGDTTARWLTTIEVNPTRFAAGGGVVVIWPSRPGQGFVDSVSLPIQVSNGPLALSPAISSASPFQIYPNPGNGKIFWQVSDPAHLPDQVVVIDLQGKYLFSAECSDTRILNFSDRLPPGSFLLRFIAGESVVSQHLYLKE
jgi:hypothetical protein